MKIFSVWFALGAAGFAGCASVAPPESTGIVVVPVRSASVGVLQPRLVLDHGRLALRGAVYRQLYAETTTRTHLDIVFLDASGAVLHEQLAHFSPAALRRAPRPPAGRGHYLVPIPALPAGTVKIEVRAHDGEHAIHS